MKDAKVKPENGFEVGSDFDWSTLDKNIAPQPQPYQLLPKLKAINNPVSAVKTKNFYKLDKETGNRVATDVGLMDLGRFKKEVLEMVEYGMQGKQRGDLVDFDNMELPKLGTTSGKKLDIIVKEMERRHCRHSVSKLITYNEANRTRDGPRCRCNVEGKKTGVHHDKYVGEEAIPKCDPNSNNFKNLHHYFLKVETTRKEQQTKTTLEIGKVPYVFEGFSIFLHKPYDARFPSVPLNDIYDHWRYELVTDTPPYQFTVVEMEAFHEYFFEDVMEMYDLHRYPCGFDATNSCPTYHCFPRFVNCDDGKKRIASMADVLACFRRSFNSVVDSTELTNYESQIFINPEKFPKAMRIDTVDLVGTKKPVLHHRAIMPSVLGNWNDREFKNLLTRNGKGRIARLVSIPIEGEGYFTTGIAPDMVLHGLHLISAISMIRYRWSIAHFEKTVLKLEFENPILLELAFTHSSFRAHFGTNASHCRTALLNVGYFLQENRQENNVRRRGFATLMDAMSVLVDHLSGKANEVVNYDNERLEFLGDAVVGFVVTARLYHIYPTLDEGFLATSRSAIVRNETLAHFASTLNFPAYLLFAHHADPFNQLDFDHALANAFEALCGAMFLDFGVVAVDKFMFDLVGGGDDEVRQRWVNPPVHELKTDYPLGDRHLIRVIPYLQKLNELEHSMGIYFNHIRILARAFTPRSAAGNLLTLGDNQTLEFLGDSVLQLVTTIKLYDLFPYHNEGNLSLLRSCIVSNSTQSKICDDLNLENYAMKLDDREVEISEDQFDERKVKADLVEALVGALFVDRGLECCIAFCDKVYVPRLKGFVISQSWSDPKSLLQQCCLTVRDRKNSKPMLPTYKLLSLKGPTNSRIYEVACYVDNERVGTGLARTMRVAEMEAASNALINCEDMFPASFTAKALYGLRQLKKDQKKEEPVSGPSEDEAAVTDPDEAEEEAYWATHAELEGPLPTADDLRSAKKAVAKHPEEFEMKVEPSGDGYSSVDNDSPEGSPPKRARFDDGRRCTSFDVGAVKLETPDS
uniref:RNase III domain-containing protein n=1 Tax=Panagrellus redivivus TaxID=6233 RepID=A0A7E4URN9_PANRE